MNFLRFAVKGLLPQGFTEFSAVAKLGMNRGWENLGGWWTQTAPRISPAGAWPGNTLSLKPKPHMSFLRHQGIYCVAFPRIRRPGGADAWPRRGKTTPHDLEKTHLLYRYAELIDGGDLAGAAALFEHARIRLNRSEGPHDNEAVLSVWRNYIKIYPCGTPRTKHVISNPIIQIDEAAILAWP
jgi:hypothetical protein